MEMNALTNPKKHRVNKLISLLILQLNLKEKQKGNI